ncbi:MAG: SLBB domain-containing protein [Armatimonadetes bacterium]|nr:SLBB domain-containing protein [Armatimonadota bacterium]
MIASSVFRCFWTRLGLTLVFAALSLIAFGQTNPHGTAAEPRLMPGDSFAILVYSHDGYGGTFTVFEDGYINDRALGRMFVKGMTIAELKTVVTKKLKETLKNPIVDVVLRGQRLPKIYLIGPERGSGAIDLIPALDMRKLVAMVSLPSEPDLLDIILYRASGQTMRLDLWGILQGKESAWNGTFEPEDIIAFLPKPFVKVWFMGPFGKGGEVKIREGHDIYEAMAEIGGFTPPGFMTIEECYFLIRRGPEMLRVPAKMDRNQRGLILQAGDVVMLDTPKVIKVYLGGEINSQGEVVVPETMPLSKLMLQAKGATDVGRLDNVLLFRGGEVMRVDATGPLTGQKPSDFKLQDGDFFWVERNERYLYAFGTINAGGKILFRDGIKMNLADLLARCGGLTQDGTLRRIQILRPGADGKYAAKLYNLDEFIKRGDLTANPEVLPGDVVLFGEPKGLTLRTLAQFLSGALLFDTLYQSRGGK